jgi:replicative DNA helicase
VSAAPDILRRVPPQDLAAEQAVLGGVIVNNELVDPVSEIIRVDDFYREAHQVIWHAIEALAEAQRPIDAVTLLDAVRPQAEAIGGAAYILELAAGVPAPRLAVQYARIVRDKAVQRRVATFATELAGRAYEAPQPWSPDHVEELIATAEYDLAAIANGIERKPEPGKAETLANVLWRLKNRAESGVPTGFATLDRVFAGFSPGHLTVLAARTSRGKTALATNIAINTAKAGHATAFFSLEQPADEMFQRAIGAAGLVNTFRARHTGYRDADEEMRAEQAAKQLQALPIEILYRPQMRPRDFRLECRRLARDLGALRFAIVDYLGMMRGDHRERERWREMGEVVLALKAIAGELGIPILLLCQINREVSDRERPSLAHLRDTGTAEEHASNVLLMWQKPEQEAASGAPPVSDWQQVELIIAKQRNGPAGIEISMEFDKRTGVFAAR